MNTRSVAMLLVTGAMLAPRAHAQLAAEVRVPNETIPAGGTVQVKFVLTEPRPITTSGTSLATDGFAINGISLFSPNGESAGFGVVRNGQLYVSAISPTGSLGTNLDYPFLTVTMNIPTTVATGTKVPLGVGPGSYINSIGGTLLLFDKPGTLTIGGSVSINNILPGGGTWPAGTLIRVLGHGFVPGTKLGVKEFKTGTVRYVSESELQFNLQQTVTLDSAQFSVKNPDGSQDIYYSYLRGTHANTSAHPVLTDSDPVFQTQTHTWGEVRSLAMTGTQFAGLAIQNPNATATDVTIEWRPALGMPVRQTITLASGARLVGDVAELVPGAAPQTGDGLLITSVTPVQMLAFYGDDAAWTVTPFLPSF